jgi:hypothetical protein
MSCAGFETLIALSVSGDLSAGEAARVETHLSECAPCRALAADLSADLQWFQNAHREPADHNTLHQVRTRVMRQLETRQSRWNRPFGGFTPLDWRWQWITVTAAVAVVLAGIVWQGRPSAELPTEITANAPGSGSRPAADLPRNPAPHSNANAPAAPRGASDRVPKPSVAAAARPAEKRAPAASRHSEPVTPEPVQSPRPESGLTDNLTAGLTDGPPLDESSAGVPVAASGEHGKERAPTVEFVLVAGEEADAAPVESVRVRMPTSNPGIVVYWLMDEKDKGD